MPKYEERLCKTHGSVRFVLEGSGYFRCTKCRSMRVSEARRKVKRKLLEFFGGKCTNCGYNKCAAALEFHHVDPTTKLFSVAMSGLYRSFKRALEEAKKCVLLCANCHREVEELTGSQVARQETVNFPIAGSTPAPSAIK